MNRLNVLVVSALAGGCTSLMGDWEGECEISSLDLKIGIELEIEDVSGSEFEGEVTVSPVGFLEEDGDVEGEKSGNELEMEFELDGWSLELEGEIEGDEIEGECTFKESGYSIEGDFELERD